MKKLSKEKQQQMMLIGLVTIMAVALMWQLVLSSRHQALKRISAEQVDLTTKIENANRLIAKKAVFEEEFRIAEERLKEVEDGMASGDLYSWAIIMLNNARRDHNIQIPEISRERRVTLDLLPEFPYEATLFSIKGYGYYHDLGAFIADFENSHPFMQLRNLELEPEPVGVGEIQERLVFRVDVVALIRPSVVN